MSTSQIDPALVRALAVIRVLSLGIAENQVVSPPLERSQKGTDRTVYFLDANVVRFLASPLQEAHHMQLFSGKEAVNLAPVKGLDQAEGELILAFAHSEAARLRGILRDKRTHVLRPHLQELAWWQSRTMGKLRQDTDEYDDDEGIDGAVIAVRTARNNLEQWRSHEEKDLTKLFNILFNGYTKGLVRRFANLAEFNALAASGLLRDPTLAAWERSRQADRSFWNQLYRKLLKIRESLGGKLNEFNVLQDAEAISLMRRYAIETGDEVCFITLDWQILRLFAQVGRSKDRLIDGEENVAPLPGAARHPLAYSSFLATYHSSAGLFQVQPFVRSIDLFFHKALGSDYESELIDFIFGNGADSSGKVDRFTDIHQRSDHNRVVDQLRSDLLFTHEDSAARFVGSYLAHPSKKDNSGVLDIMEVLDLAEIYLNERSKDKKEEILASLALIQLTDRKSGLHDSELLDEARLILVEEGLINTTREALYPRQFLRNLSGWLRLSSEQISILKDIIDKTSELDDRLVDSAGDRGELFLLGALIAGIKDDWRTSEKYADIARALLLRRPDSSAQGIHDSRLAEAEYWMAVANRHQRDPGPEKLYRADRSLQRAIQEAKSGEDHLRFEAERLALDISLFYHRYFYGDSYSGLDDLPLNAQEIRRLLIRAREQAIRFSEIAPIPETPIMRRLGLQIYTTVCHLHLFSWGLPPAQHPLQQANRAQRSDDLRRLQKLCEDGQTNVSIPITFIRLAMEFILDSNPKIYEEIQSLLEVGNDVLIPFDRKMIEDFIEIVQNGPERIS